MKITSVKTAATSGHGMHLWVKVTTDAGVIGLGECVHGGVQAIAIIRYLEEKLIGRDPFAIDAIFEQLRREHVFDGGIAGALITALTGIEIALWDLKGKALDLPIYELLGGKFRDKIRVYADCQVEPGMNFDEIRAVVDDVVARGFTALKIDVDIHAYGHKGSEVAGFTKDKFNMTAFQWEHERMVELVDMVTRAAGRDIAVAADVHTRLDAPSAIRLAHDLEPYHLMWLEEPVPAENIAAMRKVTESTTTPICSSENIYLRHGFRDLLEQQAVDIIMPDIPKCGGTVRVSQDRQHGRTLLYTLRTTFLRPIGTMASAHVCGTVPNFMVLEFHWLHRDYWTTIICEKRDIIQDGYITLSDRPGIGLELDKTVAQQHQYPGTNWFA